MKSIQSPQPVCSPTFGLAMRCEGGGICEKQDMLFVCVIAEHVVLP